MGRIIGTVLGAILAIWLAVTAAGGIVATFKTFVIIGLTAMASSSSRGWWPGALTAASAVIKGDPGQHGRAQARLDLLAAAC
jgi:hypothetical protein